MAQRLLRDQVRRGLESEGDRIADVEVVLIENSVRSKNAPSISILGWMRSAGGKEFGRSATAQSVFLRADVHYRDRRAEANDLRWHPWTRMTGRLF